MTLRERIFSPVLQPGSVDQRVFGSTPSRLTLALEAVAIAIKAFAELAGLDEAEERARTQCQ